MPTTAASSVFFFSQLQRFSSEVDVDDDVVGSWVDGSLTRPSYQVVCFLIGALLHVDMLRHFWLSGTMWALHLFFQECTYIQKQHFVACAFIALIMAIIHSEQDVTHYHIQRTSTLPPCCPALTPSPVAVAVEVQVVSDVLGPKRASPVPNGLNRDQHGIIAPLFRTWACACGSPKSACLLNSLGFGHATCMMQYAVSQRHPLNSLRVHFRSSEKTSESGKNAIIANRDYFSVSCFETSHSIKQNHADVIYPKRS